MRQEIIKNRWQYLILVSLLAIHISLFYVLWPLRQLQQIVAISLGITYFIWGIATHVYSEKLNKRVIMEYLVVSLLASSMLYLIAA